MPFKYYDPEQDARAYEEAREGAYVRANESRRCRNCGRPCGAEDHFNLWGEMIACSRDCALALMSEEDKDDIVDEWIYSQAERPVEPDERW